MLIINNALGNQNFHQCTSVGFFLLFYCKGFLSEVFLCCSLARLTGFIDTQWERTEADGNLSRLRTSFWSECFVFQTLPHIQKRYSWIWGIFNTALWGSRHTHPKHTPHKHTHTHTRTPHKHTHSHTPTHPKHTHTLSLSHTHTP